MADDQTSKTSDEEVMQAIRDHHAPAVGTVDIADMVGVTRQAVDERLEDLELDGLVEQYKPSRDNVWYLTPAGERYLDEIQST